MDTAPTTHKSLVLTQPHGQEQDSIQEENNPAILEAEISITLSQHPQTVHTTDIQLQKAPGLSGPALNHPLQLWEPQHLPVISSLCPPAEHIPMLSRPGDPLPSTPPFEEQLTETQCTQEAWHAATGVAALGFQFSIRHCDPCVLWQFLTFQVFSQFGISCWHWWVTVLWTWQSV